MTDRLAATWYGKSALLLLSVLLLTAAFAPIYQFYLAWVGLVPWLLVVRACRTQLRAFLWSWLGGTAFFIANMWWLAYVTLPGMIALLVYLGLYWGFAALILRGLGWLTPTTDTPAASPASPLQWQGPSPLTTIFGTATVWVALEWIRGNLFTGLPWLYLGHTQSPALVLCQIADALGAYGVSFWVVAVNALLYVMLVHRQRRPVLTSALAVAATLLLVIGYGAFRIAQTKSVTSPGPRVLVVQPNYPQDNSGDKGATEQERLEFHVKETEAAVRATGDVDLACWSETMLPPLNEEFRRPMRLVTEPGEKASRGEYFDKIVGRVSSLAHDYKLNVITGGLFYGGLDDKGHFTDRRNTAFLFRTDGSLESDHYDKIHLVPFGEFVPFKGSATLGWLHDLFMKFSPYDFDYTLTPGPESAPVVFTIRVKDTPPARVITPICFEDIDSSLCAKMFRGPNGKRADLLVNLTNDGWFRANENAQHLQAAVFRTIENRVPLARSVNTGVSAFVDSVGRVTATVPVRTAGTATQRLTLDSRYTPYTRVGDLFAWLCTLITGYLTATALARRWKRRRAKA